MKVHQTCKCRPRTWSLSDAIDDSINVMLNHREAHEASAIALASSAGLRIDDVAVEDLFLRWHTDEFGGYSTAPDYAADADSTSVLALPDYIVRKRSGFNVTGVLGNTNVHSIAMTIGLSKYGLPKYVGLPVGSFSSTDDRRAVGSFFFSLLQTIGFLPPFPPALASRSGSANQYKDGVVPTNLKTNVIGQFAELIDPDGMGVNVFLRIAQKVSPEIVDEVIDSFVVNGRYTLEHAIQLCLNLAAIVGDRSNCKVFLYAPEFYDRLTVPASDVYDAAELAFMPLGSRVSYPTTIYVDGETVLTQTDSTITGLNVDGVEVTRPLSFYKSPDARFKLGPVSAVKEGDWLQSLGYCPVAIGDKIYTYYSEGAVLPEGKAGELNSSAAQYSIVFADLCSSAMIMYAADDTVHETQRFAVTTSSFSKWRNAYLTIGRDFSVATVATKKRAVARNSTFGPTTNAVKVSNVDTNPIVFTSEAVISIMEDPLDLTANTAYYQVANSVRTFALSGTQLDPSVIDLILDDLVNYDDLDAEFVDTAAEALKTQQAQLAVCTLQFVEDAFAADSSSRFSARSARFTAASDSTDDDDPAPELPVDFTDLSWQAIVVPEWKDAPTTTLGELVAQVDADFSDGVDQTSAVVTARREQLTQVYNGLRESAAEKFASIAETNAYKSLNSIFYDEEGNVRTGADLAATVDSYTSSVLEQASSLVGDISSDVTSKLSTRLANVKATVLEYGDALRSKASQVGTVALNTFRLIRQGASSVTSRIKQLMINGVEWAKGNFFTNKSPCGLCDDATYTNVTGFDAAVDDILGVGYSGAKVALGALGLLGAVVKKAAQGALQTFRKFASNTFGSGSDFYVSNSGFSSLNVPALDTTISSDQLYADFPALAAKLDRLASTGGSSCLVTQLSRFILVLIREDNGALRVRVHPTIVDRNYYNGDDPNDYLFADGLADSIITAARRWNVFCTHANTYKYFLNYTMPLAPVPTKDELMPDITANVDQAASFTQNSLAAGSLAVGAAVTVGLLCLPPVGTAAALIAGGVIACTGLVASSAFAMHEYMNYEEAMATDAAFANEVYDITMLMNMWQGALPTDLVAVLANVLNALCADNYLHSGVGNCGASSDTHLPYVPLIPIANNMGWAYSLVSDEQRKRRSLTGIVLTGAAIGALAVAAVKVGVDRKHRTKLANMQAQLRQLDTKDPNFESEYTKLQRKYNYKASKWGSTKSSPSPNNKYPTSDSKPEAVDTEGRVASLEAEVAFLKKRIG